MSILGYIDLCEEPQFGLFVGVGEVWKICHLRVEESRQHCTAWGVLPTLNECRDSGLKFTDG